MRNWNELKDTVRRDDKGKKDFVVPVHGIDYSNYRNLLRMECNFDYNGAYKTVPLYPNEHAFNQIASRLGVPTLYAKRCLEQDACFLAGTFNFWHGVKEKEEYLGKDWLIRTKQSTCRAVLSDKYSVLDNNFIVKNVLDSSIVSASKIQDFYISDTSFYLRVVVPELTVDIGTLKNPDKVSVGFHVSNSEVGLGAVNVESYLFRQVCTNGMIIRVGEEILLHQRHIHLTDKEIKNRLLTALNQSVTKGNEAIDIFARSKEIAVEDPLELIKKLAKEQKYSQNFMDNTINSFNSEPENSVFGIVNAFTSSAKILPYDNRVEVESFAGDFMQKMVKSS